MNADMFLEVTQGCEELCAAILITVEGFASMQSLVGFQSVECTEGLLAATDLTAIWFLF